MKANKELQAAIEFKDSRIQDLEIEADNVLGKLADWGQEGMEIMVKEKEAWNITRLFAIFQILRDFGQGKKKNTKGKDMLILRPELS